jgi:hypothetical protein
VVPVVDPVAPGVPDELFDPGVADDDVPGVPGVDDADEAVPGSGDGCEVPFLLSVESVLPAVDPPTDGIAIPTAAAAESEPELDGGVEFAAFFVDPVPGSVSLDGVVDVTAELGATSAETTDSLPLTTPNVPKLEPSAPKPA